MKGVLFLNGRYTKGVAFLSKMVWSLFPQNLVNYPTPGPGQFKRSIYDFYVSTENINFSRKDQLVTEEHPERWTTFQGIKTEFPAMQHFLLFTKISAGVLPVPIFWHNVGSIFLETLDLSPCPIFSLSLARSYYLFIRHMTNLYYSRLLRSLPQCY